MMSANKLLNNYFWKNYFYTDGQLFKVQDNMLIETVDSTELLNNITSRLNTYASLSKYTCLDNKLLPTAVFNQFLKRDLMLQQSESFEFEFGIPASKNAFLDSTHFAEGTQSLNSGKAKYISIIKSLILSSFKPVRVLVDLKIYCPDGLYPTIYFNHKTAPVNSEDFKLHDKYIARPKNAIFYESSIPSWMRYRAHFWITPQQLSQNLVVKHNWL